MKLDYNSLALSGDVHRNKLHKPLILKHPQSNFNNGHEKEFFFQTIMFTQYVINSIN